MGVFASDTWQTTILSFISFYFLENIMKTVSTFLRSALLCAVLGVVAFGFASQSASAQPRFIRLVPAPAVGPCCFEVIYDLPAAEANVWVDCTVAPIPGNVIGISPNVGFGGIIAGPNAILTHPAGPGFLPTGVGVVMGVVCFNIPGASNVTLTFHNRFGGVFIVMRRIVCGLVAAPAALPDMNSVENGLSTTTTTSGSGISLASSTESITDNQLADITPNPTSDNATVSLALANDMDNVSLYVADMTGRKMLDITTGERLTMGTHSFSVETQNLTSGVYYVVVKSGQFTQAKMLQVIK